MVLEDVGVGENVAKMCVTWEYSLAHPRINCREGVYELEDHVGQEALNSNLLLRFGHVKRIPFIDFPNYLLESVWVESSSPYVHWPPFEGAKQDTTRVIKWANSKLFHHRGLVPTYQMKNEMIFVHHIVKW